MAIRLRDYNPAMRDNAIVDFGDQSSGTVSGGSATINAQVGKATVAVSAGTASTNSFDLVNDRISADSILLLSLENDNVTAGSPVLTHADVKVAGSATIRIANPNFTDAGAALAGTAVVNFAVLS